VKGFDVYNALEACSQHLEQFGGHMYAAEWLWKKKIIPFKEAFEKQVQETIHPTCYPEIDIDAEINFADITQTNSDIKQFEPRPAEYDSVFWQKT
jgi:single-stranded-DNA-specific exonuclease